MKLPVLPIRNGLKKVQVFEQGSNIFLDIRSYPANPPSLKQKIKSENKEGNI